MTEVAQQSEAPRHRLRRSLSNTSWDYDTPIEETLEALHDVVKAGKARYIGASSMHACSSPRPCTSPTSTAGLAS